MLFWKHHCWSNWTEWSETDKSLVYIGSLLVSKNAQLHFKKCKNIITSKRDKNTLFHCSYAAFLSIKKLKIKLGTCCCHFLNNLLDLAFPFVCSAQLEFQNGMNWLWADNFIYEQSTEISSKGSFKRNNHFLSVLDTTCMSHQQACSGSNNAWRMKNWSRNWFQAKQRQQMLLCVQMYIGSFQNWENVNALN